MKSEQEYRVELTTGVFGGETLGRLADGKVVLVPYALPGEEVRLRAAETRAGYLRGEILEVLRASPLRRPPRCRHFGDCGGCHYQHLDYPQQLELKRGILRDQLHRIGGLPDPPVEPAVPAPSPWSYRNQLQFHLGPRGSFGFHGFRSHRIVPLSECHLPEGPIAAWWPRLSSATLWPGVRRLVLRADSAGGRLAVLEAGPGRPGEPRREPPPLPELEGADRLEMSVLEEAFQVSPLSFFQVNTAGAALLVQRVLECCGEDHFAHTLDLYCGVGLFSRFLLPHSDRLTGVELSPSACADFRVNCPTGAGIRLIERDAAAALAGLRDSPDLIVADPPRAGLGPEVVELASRLRPRRLVYVSCDPATLARDAAALLRHGWALRRVIPVDLFPQTAHIESVSLWQ